MSENQSAETIGQFTSAWCWVCFAVASVVASVFTAIASEKPLWAFPVFFFLHALSWMLLWCLRTLKEER